MSEKEPEVVWHYTGCEVLDAILGSKALRQTHADYLNDPEERRLLYAAWDGALEDRAPNLRDLRSSERPQDAARVLAPFSTSFSKNRDNLLLWVNYARNLSGVAIGFRTSYLRGLSNDLGVPGGSQSLVEIVYEKAAPDTLAQDILGDFLQNPDVAAELVRSGGQITPGLQRVGIAVVDVKLAAAATQFKSPGWSQEEEWRITWQRSLPSLWIQEPGKNGDLTAHWQYDSRSPGKPFLSVPFDPAEAITEVVVGPCGSEERVNNILEHHGLHVPVQRSPTKYRTI